MDNLNNLNARLNELNDNIKKIGKHVKENNNKSKVKYKESIKNIERDLYNFDKKSNARLIVLDNKISTLNDKISKIKYTIKDNKALTNIERNEL